MRLKKITLSNFRQFHGSQVLDLSEDPERNLTLIHAENGVGKTTLLNSVLWCFYGTVTKKFEQADKILNFQAKAEGQSIACVEVTFDHENEEYMAQRQVCGPGGGRTSQQFTVFHIRRGTHRAVPAPDTFINSVIPEEMAPYFFFDGEHAETFSAGSNAKKVGQAIRNMLGCI